MFTCKWKEVGENAFRTSCSDLIAAQNLLGAYRGAFAIIYCPNCGKKIKVVKNEN